MASLTPIKVGSDGVVLEATVDQGARRETLRAPCQVTNCTVYCDVAAAPHVSSKEYGLAKRRGRRLAR